MSMAKRDIVHLGHKKKKKINYLCTEIWKQRNRLEDKDQSQLDM